MKQLVARGFAALFLGLGGWGTAWADSAEATVKTIAVPDGFTVELVAAAPLVQHPVMAGFDERGRLFVADNAGLNLPADELLKQLPNMIRMLEDTDGDGRFDRGTLFADKMTFPQGAAWYRGALYVASPPSIWRLEDTDGDGVADRREEIVHKFGFVGNAADIHGCFITPTGRIAWCDGRHGHEFKGGKGQMPSKGLAARVFSCRPDGSDVEVFCGGGMDNPVEIAFTSEGETIGTMTFYNPDDVRHDALVHFVHGGVYPRKHPCTEEFKRTGDFMPALARFGTVAPSGLTRYAGATWGETYRDNLYSTHFNTHKVLRHVLARQGATFDCVNEDFLVSTNVDFHPTDVLQDADGSLLVIDTGGWFHIGCPTSQVAKPEIGGGIYRVRRKDAPAAADPRGTKITWESLSDTETADLLADPRPAVAERAINLLVDRGDAAMGSLATALFDGSEIHARQNAVWALARIGTESARLLLNQALADDDAPVRQAAVHVVSDLRDQQCLAPLVDILGKDEPAVRREAATALGRLGLSAAVPALLEGLRQPADRFVEHALIYALIEIHDRPTTLAGLSHEHPQVRRGALIALDQMEGGALSREEVVPLLATEDTALIRTLIDILAKHPDWTNELSGTVGGWLAIAKPTAEQMATTRGAISALIARPSVQKLAAEALANSKTSTATRLMLLEVIAQNESAAAAGLWNEALKQCLASGDVELLGQAIATAAVLDVKPLSPRLIEIGLQASYPAPLRSAAWRAASKANPPLPAAAFEFLAAHWADDGAARDRLSAAEALGGFALNDEQRLNTTRLLQRCGPLEVSWLLRAFEQDAQPRTGLALVNSLEKSPALASIPSDRLREMFKSYPFEVQSAAEKLFKLATPDDQERIAKLKSLEASIQGGDALRGETIFFSQRAACSACHRIVDRGEKIGPDLSKIGEIRNHRDLLEALVFPSVSLARGYESFNVTTHEGKVFGGLLSRETASAIYLRTTDRVEIRIERGDIDALSPSLTSIMPQGLDKVLTIPDLRDVIAYLQSRK